jgi:hypothetical protein
MADKIMKRYFAFMGDTYYPCGGMSDFVGDFANLEDAIAALTMDHKTLKSWGDNYTWGIVWDSEIRTNVWDETMLPKV